MTLLFVSLRRFLLALALAWISASPARAEAVALTLDDLPALSLSDDPAYARTTTQRLVDALASEDLPATGFINGSKWAAEPQVRDRLLRNWVRRGFELGNHTWSHESLNTMPAADYVADIARNDALLRTLERPPAPRWFRHPYLETGATNEARNTVDSWLARHGYRVAPVTLENADDIFAEPYDAAIAHHDRRRAAALRTAYLRHSARCIAWYRKAALALTGRRIPLIFLLHASRLNADTMPELVALLRDAGLQPVSLAAALADPIYRQGDGPPDPNGDDWLERWAAAEGRDLPWDSFPEVPADIAAESRRLDSDR